MPPKHLFCLALVLFFISAKADIVIDDFNDNTLTSWYNSSSYQLSESNGELSVGSNKTAFRVFQKGFSRLDMSKHCVIQMRIKVKHPIAPVVRIDLEDANGFIGNTFSTQVITLPDSQYATYTFNFRGRFSQSYNTAGQFEKRILDSTKIVRLTFHFNAPGTYTGTVFFDDIILLGAQPRDMVPLKSEWNYFSGLRLPAHWTSLSYDDSGWLRDTAAWGMGDARVHSSIQTGPDAQQKFIQHCFRKKFQVVDKSQIKSLVLECLHDDGVILYLNGTEVWRHGVPAQEDSFTLASQELTESEERWHRILLDTGMLLPGENVLSAQVHLSSPSDADALIDLRLFTLPFSRGIIRGPYLQATGTQQSKIRWRTLEESGSHVRYGLRPDALIWQVDSARSQTEHQVVLSNLQASTTYYYAILSDVGDTLAGADSTHFVRTHPVTGSVVPIRAWVTGDAGKENNEQRSMRDSYYQASKNKNTDFWLLLGDNAYNEGTDEEYQYAMFQDMFEKQMTNTTIFPAPGNHDLRTYVNNLEQAPYYQIFSTPTEGESGGFASHSKAYYSFDYGNAHFISLDSYGTPRDSTEAMAAWLKNDLAQTQARWKIAFWHHPPFTKGSHDSDNILNSNDNTSNGKSRLFEMREQLLPILEKAGIDLVLCGHSHVYERSYLIHGHYGVSSTFNDAPHIVNGVTSGRKSLGEAYRKNPEDPEYPNLGTVYAVVGCSGLKSQSVLGWPLWQIMHFSSAQSVGSMVLEIHADTLTGKFLTSNGLYPDEFSIVKDAQQPISLVTSRQYGKSETKEYLHLYPNPAQDKISLDYRIPSAGTLEVVILDAQGREVKKLLKETLVPGTYHQDFLRGSLRSGTYHLVLKLDGKTLAEQGILFID
ncbi:MAG: metallophosphoesterase [Cytophagaceae bacterium]|jgi:hypothetical protein|nr:metallophosphoesterase [Cytophagaceae bacterium]